MAIASVYIDGFNLYYGAVKNSPFKWLDLGALCRRMLPCDTIQSIEYFTAIVSARPYRSRHADAPADVYPGVTHDSEFDY